eukprot:m.22017 g.22017  ORF g.22017 m.22017 type:complete len:223 (+) comp3949_c0_seq1:302-970(+)
MWASLATVSTSTVQECVAELHGLNISSNPLQDCLEPLVTQVTQYLTDITLAAAGMLGAGASGSHYDDDGHLWYRAPDFERFKEDVLDEARRAGCKCPQSQYYHIRSKYLDDVTMRNTALNLKASSPDASDEESPPSNEAPSHMSARTASAPATVGTTASEATTVPNKTGPKRKRRTHRRSVSWSKELHQVASDAPEPSLSARDEAARILDEEDTAELKEIFL